LSYFSEASQIQQFLFWSFGSLGNLSWNELFIFIAVYSIAILASIGVIKPLNSLLLGENYAKSAGINIKKSRNIILLICNEYVLSLHFTPNLSCSLRHHRTISSRGI
jgi:iron complex transport system permease protein